MNSIHPTADGTPWLALESVPGLCAMPAAWAAYLADFYSGFRERFLRPNPALGDPTASHVPLHFSWQHFGPAMARAFGCLPVASQEMGENTRQVGAWSVDATPVFLTCNAEPLRFELAIMRLCAVWDRPFILFAPSKRFLSADCVACLDRRRAACFSLAETLALTPSGVLQARSIPGEMFAAFRPAGDMQQEAAVRALELVRRLDDRTPGKPPSATTVLHLYCTEALSMKEVARRCRCSKATVFRRLREIQRQIGITPERLRTYSPHLEHAAARNESGRARRIWAHALADNVTQADTD